jgi:hypothetical protein
MWLTGVMISHAVLGFKEIMETSQRQRAKTNHIDVLFSGTLS